MKLVARSYFWYPGLDKDLEYTTYGCVECQAEQITCSFTSPMGVA